MTYVTQDFRKQLIDAMCDQDILKMVLAIMPLPVGISKELFFSICDKTMEIVADTYVDVLLEHYTPDELMFSIELMQNPLMRSMLKKTPAAMLALKNKQDQLQPVITPMIVKMITDGHGASLH